MCNRYTIAHFLHHCLKNGIRRLIDCYCVNLGAYGLMNCHHWRSTQFLISCFQRECMITALLFAIGIVLIAGVVAFFGVNEVLNVIFTSNAWYIAAAVIIQAAILLLLAGRLVLIARKHYHIGFIDAFKITMSGMAISMLTPIAKIGGEPLKIYLLKKKKMDGSEATAVIAVDTLAERGSSLLFVLFIFVMFAEHVPGVIFSSFVVFLIVVAAILVVFLKLLLNPRWMRKLIRWTAKRISRASHARKKDYARLFYNAFNVLIKDRKILAGSFGISRSEE